MSVRVMAWVFDQAPTSNPTDQLVLLAIADRCDDDGLSAYPSVATIAKKTRLAQRTVTRAVQRLRAAGVIEVRAGEGRNGTNVYSVAMTPCRRVTPDAGSPLTERHPTPDTASVTPRRRFTPPPVGESPDPSSTSSTSGTSESIAPAAADLLGTRWVGLTTVTVAPVRQLIDGYVQRFEAAHGLAPQIDGARDSRIFKTLVAQHPVQTILGALDRFFADPEPFIANSGHTLTLFRSQFNRFLVAAQRPSAVSVSPKTAGNVAAAARFVARGVVR